MEHCSRCFAPATTGYLCTGCLIGLRIELTDVAGLIPDNWGKGPLQSLPDELNTTLSRADQISDPSEGRVTGTGEIPLIYKGNAAEALWILTSVLEVWAQELGFPSGHLPPRDLAGWFLENLGLVGKSPAAGQLADEVTDAIHQARRAIDRPSDERIYLGVCQPGLCREELYAAGPWIDVITCSRCLTNYRVTGRQEWLRARVAHFSGTAEKVAGFLRATGVQCTAEQVRGYARSRNGRPPRLNPVGRDGKGHALYSLTDVISAISGRYARHRTLPDCESAG